MDLPSAHRAILGAAGGKEIIFLLDGNLPCQELLAAEACCRAWPQAKLSFVVEPADEQLLLGTETSGAEYLRTADLTGCDGFLVVGDAFAANPVCAGAILDRRRSDPKTPLVAVDPACGSAWKFATHRIEVAPDAELAAVLGVAQAAGVKLEGLGAAAKLESPSVTAAGDAIAPCKRLGVIIAAEYGRTGAWWQIGLAAGRLAKAFGGGVTPCTTGANALAAVRLAGHLGSVPLAHALSADQAIRVTIGCDVLGMLGWQQADIFAAAAALPNRTSNSAEVVLPLAMPGEMAGTYLFDADDPAEIPALLPPPAGVLRPGEVVASLAEAAGVKPLRPDPGHAPLERIRPLAPVAAMSVPDPRPPLLLVASQAMHSGCGSLTGWASWQGAVQDLPELRLSSADLEGLGLKNLAVATVRAGGCSVRARVRLCPELGSGTYVLSDGFPDVRMLLPCTVRRNEGVLVAAPGRAEVSG